MPRNTEPTVSSPRRSPTGSVSSLTTRSITTAENFHHNELVNVHVRGGTGENSVTCKLRMAGNGDFDLFHGPLCTAEDHRLPFVCNPTGKFM